MPTVKPKVDLSDFPTGVTFRQRCTVGKALDALKPDQREKAVAALSSMDITHRAISSVLSKWSGITVRESTIGRHRRKGCACE